MNELSYVIYIGAKPEEVWQALLSPEGTKAIFFGCVIRSTFEIGSTLEYVGPGNDGDETVHVYGNVLAFEPNRLLSVTEHPGPSYSEHHAELETRITMTLEPVGACTKFTLVNDQWPDNHPSRANTEQSWPIILSNIKSYVETGKGLDLGW
ncbi:polyketide cyclase [Paenibacillus mesophilus]|uniref:SRPBCC family protein n=1 Tax=Paenibacillus mesophilus TaxID=2582849 RepID=UPI00110E1BEC|nr:SRPBCC family protein [Paenibacillus mesophilus]TMV48935.1 polyketide cyclase [Paenibacillus mesophilus]